MMQSALALPPSTGCSACFGSEAGLAGEGEESIRLLVEPKRLKI